MTAPTAAPPRPAPAASAALGRDCAVDVLGPMPGARGAPLLAVCGVCGGAGASTLSLLLARFLAQGRAAPVLVADTGGPTGGLSDLAGTDARRTLLEAAELHARGVRWSAPLYAVDRAGSGELRVLATGPRALPFGTAAALEALLQAVRADGAHAAVIVDCGTLQCGPERLIAHLASHRAWVLPATATGVRRAAHVLDSRPAAPDGHDVLVAMGAQRAAGVLRDLTALAEQRRTPLILLPQLPDAVEHPARALETAAAGLQALAGVLER